MAHNGPAIKCRKRCVAIEGRKAGCSSRQKSCEAGMSEAWRAFCRPGTIIFAIRVSRYNVDKELLSLMSRYII
jgi:hypothetical protein